MMTHNITQESLSTEYVKSQSKIYGCKSKSPLTKYQESINQAAMELCLQNPALLGDRNALLEASRKRLDETGYIYKKEKSCSKRFSTDNEELAAKKKPKIKRDFRIARISELHEQIDDKNE